MAYMTQVSPIGSKPVKKKKPKTIYSGGVDAQPAKASAGSFTAKNTTTNARAGQSYRTEVRPGGVVHVYESGERVFVKKPKKFNPSRKLY